MLHEFERLSQLRMLLDCAVIIKEENEGRLDFVKKSIPPPTRAQIFTCSNNSYTVVTFDDCI